MVGGHHAAITDPSICCLTPLPLAFPSPAGPQHRPGTARVAAMARLLPAAAALLLLLAAAAPAAGAAVNDTILTDGSGAVYVTTDQEEKAVALAISILTGTAPIIEATESGSVKASALATNPTLVQAAAANPDLDPATLKKAMITVMAAALGTAEAGATLGNPKKFP